MECDNDPVPSTKPLSQGWHPIITAPKDRQILIFDCTKYGHRVDYAVWAAWGVSDSHNWMTLDGDLLPNEPYKYWMDVPELSDDK